MRRTGAIQRDVFEKLLGRKVAQLKENGHSYLEGKTVLVTGAGGSIGSEICRQLILAKPKKLILLGHGENSIYEIVTEICCFHQSIQTEIVTEIGDIQDQKRMTQVMEMYKPNVVYHAAAHKHVPLMEKHPGEAVKNNIFGTKHVAEAASAVGVERFVLISTDKAVHPTSVMGATKRIAEIIIQQLNETSNTNFVTVRFGNVLGSRGSVVPFFQKQIEQGGPITITHPEMTRYFMTIEEASRLVIQASILAENGGIFILDMGNPIKIVDLAKVLICEAGYQPSEIPIQFTGIREGEKLHEELLWEEEREELQLYPGIYYGKSLPIYLPSKFIYEKLNEKIDDSKGLRSALFSLLKGQELVAKK